MRAALVACPSIAFSAIAFSAIASPAIAGPMLAFTGTPYLSGQDAAPSRAAALSQGPASFDPALSPGLEVVRVKTGHLLVRPKVNGREAGWFIFDTGAGICVVSTPHVEALQLTPAGDIDALGVGGGESAGLHRAATLSLGPITLRDHPFMTTDLSFLETHLGKEIAGVIGFGVLSRCVAEIDLVTPRVALHDPATFELPAGEWGEWTPIELDTRIPVVQARFEDREGLFSLDTGSNSAVSFHEPAVRKWKLLAGREVSDAKLGGVGGFVDAKKGVVEWFELGGVRQEKVSATFALETKGTHAQSRIDGTIGAELLAKFVLVTDYAMERIAFRPREVTLPAQAR